MRVVLTRRAAEQFDQLPSVVKVNVRGGTEIGSMNRVDARRAEKRREARGFVIVPARNGASRRGREPVVNAVRFALKSIGRDLSSRRRQVGLSQAEVAARAGIRVETLSRLENGRGNPTVATVVGILRALGTRRRARATSRGERSRQGAST